MNDSKSRIDWGEAVVPGLALLFVLAYFFQTRNAPMEALYWPIMVAIVLGVFFLLVVIQFIVRKRVSRDVGQPANGDARPWTKRYGPAAMVLLLPIGYVLIIPFLGFSISSFLLMQFIFRGLGSRKWGVNVAVGLAITLFLYLALVVFMQLSIPTLELGPIVL